jgi:serine/threonine protein kinase
MKKRTTKDAGGRAGGFIAGGTYNCAHFFEADDGTIHVLRIALLEPDNESRVHIDDMVMRGLQIVNVMQRYNSELGPSLVKEIEHFTTKDAVEIYEYFSSKDHPMCRKILEEIQNIPKHMEYMFAVQITEYLSGETVAAAFNSAAVTNLQNFTSVERDFCAFALIWFLAVAQKRFGLRHRDIKESNVCFRVRTVLSPLTFVLGNTVFTFPPSVRYVPVVIDYDFATVSDSLNDEDRNVLGTYSSAPPEAILRELTGKKLPVNPLEGNAYDWWSIGIMIMSIVCNVDLYVTLCWAERRQHTNKIVNALNVVAKHKVEKLKLLLMSLSMHAVITATLYTTTPVIEVQPFLSVAKAACDAAGVSPALFQLFFNPSDYNVMFSSASYGDFSAKVSTLSNGQRRLLQTLLSWVPEARVQGGQPWTLLHDPLFMAYKTTHGAQIDFQHDPLLANELVGRYK